MSSMPSSTFGFDLAHILGTLALLLSFSLLLQRRLIAQLQVFALHAITISAMAACLAYLRESPELYVTSALTFLLKGVFIPLALLRIITRLNIHRTIDPTMGIGWTLVLGLGVVTLVILLVMPVTEGVSALTREDLALSLSIVLLGFLTMISRRNAVSQVVGFMSMENGLLFAATSVNGMPLIVEMSVAFAVLVGFIIFGIFFFHIRERFDSLDVRYLESFRRDRE